jgi:hypothetical protein
MWRVLRKRFKAYNLSSVQYSNIWNTIEIYFETPCITNGSRIELYLSQVKLGVFCCTVTVQNAVHVL